MKRLQSRLHWRNRRMPRFSLFDGLLGTFASSYETAWGLSSQCKPTKSIACIPSPLFLHVSRKRGRQSKESRFIRLKQSLLLTVVVWFDYENAMSTTIIAWCYGSWYWICDLKQVTNLNRSCPAVSQICSLIRKEVGSVIWIDLIFYTNEYEMARSNTKSIPIVGM